MQLSAQDLARFPRPGTAVPANIAFVPDGRRLSFLFSDAGTLARSLWEILWFLARVAGASSAPVRSSAARAAQSRAALAPTFVSGQ